jgi:hypothetical protein
MASALSLSKFDMISYTILPKLKAEPNQVGLATEFGKKTSTMARFHLGITDA